MTIRALLLLGGVSLALAGAASAQSAGPPAAAASPPAAADAPAAPAALPPPTLSAAPASVPAASSQPGVPPQRLRAMVRASGFDPIGPPVRHGNLLVQRAIGPNDVEYRLVIDPLTGRTVSVRPMRVAGLFGGPAYYGPRPYYPPRYRPAYGRYWGPPADYGFSGAPRPPRAVPAATAHLTPPPSEPQPSATAQPNPQPSTVAQAPLPRPKPYVMEATGSIPADSPQPLRTQRTAERQPPPARPAQDNGAAAMPPIAPLD